jgi:serine/threonine protein kinase
MDSPCLINLDGAFLEEVTVTMVLEYMACGSLEHILNQRNNVPFSGPKVAAIAFQILVGLEHLHNQRILHRDVKSENALMHSDGSIKLCDFGLASMGDQSLHKTVVGTTTFMAPERLRAQPYGRSSDIWSFGLLLRHIASGDKPWSDISSIVDLLMTVEETPVMDLIPGNLEAGLKEIMKSCLQQSPPKRMPAKLLLKSPWFSVHHIRSVADAIEILIANEEEDTKRGLKRKKEMSPRR